ncbi:MAG: GDP-mannose 4,6-dehydratase, partial [Promethearchaeota archaeon]
MLKNKKILITGAGGFIGSHLTEELLKHDNFVVLIDNFNDYYTGKEKQLNSIIENYKLHENYELYKDDLLNSSVYNRIETDIEYVFHLAAQAGVRYSLEHPSEVSYNNIVSTVNVFEFSKKLENLKKVVFASSSSVYGNPIYTPVDEQHPKNPISPYAVSKLSGELYGDLYYKEFNIPITSLRFYTVYGPRGRPDMAIRKFFNLIFQGNELIIF